MNTCVFMKITIDIQENPRLPQFGGQNTRGISDISIGVNNSESLSDIIRAFRTTLYAMEYTTKTIDQHLSVDGEFLGAEEEDGA